MSILDMIGEWLVSKVPGPLVPVAAVLYGMALEARDAIKESTHAKAKRCHRG